MESLPREVILVLVEQMDTRTRKNFMLTCKTFAELVRRNKKSISNNQAKQFDLPPTGDILSSNSRERKAVKLGTWRLVSELELRHSRIQFLLCPKSSFIEIASTPPPDGLGQMSPEQGAHLLRLYRRALWHCDAISDITARHPDTLPEVNLELHPRELWADQVRHEEMLQLFQDDPFRHFQARPAQIEYIKALSVEEQAVLILFVNTIGIQFARAHRFPEPEHLNRHTREQITLFEEFVLRHGSWLLWTEIYGRTQGARDHLDRMMHAGMEELLDWESNDVYAMPGLKMTLMTEFRKRVTGRNKVMPKVCKVVAGLLGIEAGKKNSKGDNSNNDVDNQDDYSTLLHNLMGSK